MISKDYELFIWSCFPNDMHAWREGLQYESLLRLKKDEKKKAGDLILTNLQDFLNGAKIEKRVVESAGWLQLQDSIPYLDKLLRLSTDFDLRAQIGLALHRIQKYPEGLELAIEAFENIPANDEWNRRNAADYIMVYAMEYKSAVRFLLQAINDNNKSVAFYVVGNLKRIFIANLEIKNFLEIIAETLVLHNRQNSTSTATRQSYLIKVSALIENELTQRHWQ